MAKQELREVLIKRRADLSSAEVKNLSAAIFKKLTAEVEWPKVGRICLYQAVATLKEVETKPIIDYLADKYPEVEIGLVEAQLGAQPPSGPFGIIIVPVLGFDKDRHRLGWGGGWYDRFLAAQPDSLKIGLAYENGFIKDGLPAEPHDVRLDKIITESAVY